MAAGKFRHLCRSDREPTVEGFAVVVKEKIEVKRKEKRGERGNGLAGNKLTRDRLAGTDWRRREVIRNRRWN